MRSVRFSWTRSIMFAMAAAVALLAASSTQAASVKEIFEKYNLVGIFAWDCTRPPTKDNLYFVNRVLDEGHVQRDEMSGPTARDWATIIDTAVELTQGEISVSGDRDGVRSEIVWRLQENRARGVESTLGGKKLIAGGKWTSNGQEVPWVNKCDAPSTQTQSSPRSPQADSEDVPRVQNVPGAQAQNESVKAIFEKYNLLGVFAQDCSKPPKAVENWYYVNRLIDANHVQRDLMESPTTRKSVTIIDNAAEATPNGILVIGTRDGKPAQGIWRLEKDRMVQWESALAGQQEISAGKWVRTGTDMPWLYRCGAPGQQQMSASQAAIAVAPVPATIASLTATAQSGVKTKVSEHVGFEKSCAPQHVVVKITTPPANGSVTTAEENLVLPARIPRLVARNHAQDTPRRQPSSIMNPSRSSRDWINSNTSGSTRTTQRTG